MRKMLISKAEFAKRCDVSQSAINQVCKGSLKEALIDGKININNRKALEYMAAKLKAKQLTDEDIDADEGLRGKAVAKQAKINASDPSESIPIPENLAPYIHMTLAELIEKYGTSTALIDWLKAVKEIEVIEEKRLKNKTTRSTLIDRDFVLVNLFGAMEDVFSKLLSDLPRTITTTVLTLNEAGEDKEEIEKNVYKNISTTIKNSKQKTIKQFKGLKRNV